MAEALTDLLTDAHPVRHGHDLETCLPLALGLAGGCHWTNLDSCEPGIPGSDCQRPGVERDPWDSLTRSPVPVYGPWCTFDDGQTGVHRGYITHPQVTELGWKASLTPRQNLRPCCWLHLGQSQGEQQVGRPTDFQWMLKEMFVPGSEKEHATSQAQ